MQVRLVHSAKASTTPGEKSRMVATLQDLLRDSFRLRNQGAAYAKLANAQGYADGYMRSLLDLGLVTDQELLAIVAEVRRGVDGPATRLMNSELLATSA